MILFRSSMFVISCEKQDHHFRYHDKAFIFKYIKCFPFVRFHFVWFQKRRNKRQHKSTPQITILYFSVHLILTLNLYSISNGILYRIESIFPFAYFDKMICLSLTKTKNIDFNSFSKLKKKNDEKIDWKKIVAHENKLRCEKNWTLLTRQIKKIRSPVLLS